MNPSYIDNFEEYKMIGITKLTERANIVRQNKKFAEKVELILRDEAEEKGSAKEKKEGSAKKEEKGSAKEKEEGSA